MYNKNTWLYKICFKKGYKKHERNTWILKNTCLYINKTYGFKRTHSSTKETLGIKNTWLHKTHGFKKHMVLKNMGYKNTWVIKKQGYKKHGL